MKALLINGSPRKGNTYAALAAIEEGLKSAGGVEIDNIVLQEKKIAPCMACEACRGNGGNCVIGDDGNDLIEKLYHADIVVLGSPVYWWGVSAQMKLFLDRMYSKGEGNLSNKKLGIVITGGDSLENVQYDLISRQLRAIAKYLDWEVVFEKCYSAYAEDEIAGDEAKTAELTELGKRLK